MIASSPRFTLGVGIGRAFTTAFAFDEATGAILTAKVPTTRTNPLKGVMAAIWSCVQDFSQISLVVHGAEAVSDALLDGRAAKTGLIVTTGFADRLDLGRGDPPDFRNPHASFEALIPRDLRIEITERVLASGASERRTDTLSVLEAAQKLLGKGCEAAAILFINASANPANERAAVEAVRAIWPNPYVVASMEASPGIGEFERFSTAALTACLQPVMADHLTRFEKAFAMGGGRGAVLIARAAGSAATLEEAKRHPIDVIASGSATAVAAAARIAEAAGFPDVVACDVGATACRLSIVAAGRPAFVSESVLDGGLVVRRPAIDMTRGGAGGGAFAWVDKDGFIRVGPDSAGCDPGPVCWDRGGDWPTLTDAHLALGRIDPDRPMGGLVERLDRAAAVAAVSRHVGEPLRLSPLDAAEAIVRTANAEMAGAIRTALIRRGHDPKGFAVCAFGGGGGLHAGALIREAGLKAALIPRHPGALAAMGCVMADVRAEAMRPMLKPLDAVDPAALARELIAEAAACEDALKRMEFSWDRIDRVFALDAVQPGRTQPIGVELSIEDGSLTRDALLAAFGRAAQEAPLTIVARRVAAVGRRRGLDVSARLPDAGGTLAQSRIGARRVYANKVWHEAPVYDRLALPAGAVVRGFALLEQADATILIDPGVEARVDPFGNLLMGWQA